MTGLSHLHPDFSSVFAIEAVNEPIMDANQTPGYGDCKFLMAFRLPSFCDMLLPDQKKFVETVRAMESLLGVNGNRRRRDVSASLNVTSVFDDMMHKGPCGFGLEICQVLLEALPILTDISFELPGFNLGSIFGLNKQPPLMTKFVFHICWFISPTNHHSTVSWTSAGNLTIPVTLPTLHLDRKDTTTTFTMCEYLRKFDSIIIAQLIAASE